MMLLTTRLRLDPDGKPHVPGNLEVWKNLFTNHPQGKYDGKLTRLATTWKEPDDVIEALFALCRKTVENEPLKIFMAVSDLDRNRQQPLQPATVERLAREYHDFGAQYPIFSESRSVSDKTVVQFLDTLEAVNKIHEPAFRSDAIGSFQGMVSLWQILVRQQSIPDGQADATLSAIAGSFTALHNNRDLFDAGRDDIKRLLAACGDMKGTAAGTHGRGVERRRFRGERCRQRRAPGTRAGSAAHSGSAAYDFARYAVRAGRQSGGDAEGREAEHRAGQQADGLAR